MTVEERLLVSPKDVVGITIICSACQGRIMMNLQQFPKTHPGCPLCNTEWLTEGDDAVKHLANAIKHLTPLADAEKPPYRVFLELAAPDA